MTGEEKPHTLCGEEGECCPVYGIECGSEIEKCPVYRTFRIVGKKWSLQIIQEFCVNGGERRFSEIQHSLPWITPKVLSKRLKEMQAKEILHREVFSDEFPVGVEYSLTEKGKGLKKVIKEAKQWGMKWEVVEEE